MGARFFKHKIEKLVTVEKIVTVHYLEYPEGYVFPGESHDFWELVYVDKGGVICSRDGGEEFALRQGQLIFHKPGEFHTIRADKTADSTALIVSFVCRSQALPLFHEEIFTPNKAQKSLLSEIINEAGETFYLPPFDPDLKKLELKRRPPLGGLQMIKLNLEKLMILLMRSKQTADGPFYILENLSEGGFVRGVTDYLKSNVYEKLTLSDICRACNYGQTYLCTNFKKTTGKTVFQYFIQLKINEAKKLIREDSLSFAEIADKLNFDSYSYFVKVFKSHVGSLPKEYKKSLYPRV